MYREKESIGGKRIIIIGCPVNFVATRRAPYAPRLNFSIYLDGVFCASRNRDLPTSFASYTMYYIIRESEW